MYLNEADSQNLDFADNCTKLKFVQFVVIIGIHVAICTHLETLRLPQEVPEIKSTEFKLQIVYIVNCTQSVHLYAVR